MPHDEITSCVRRLRFGYGKMTRQDLADRAGCTRRTIVALEQGRYVCSLSRAVSIVRVFGRRIEVVFEPAD